MGYPQQLVHCTCYSDFTNRNFQSQIDYLQLDIDPNFNTLKCLKCLPLVDYRFSVITYETDLYDPNMDRTQSLQNREEARHILNEYGYELIVGNICNTSTEDPFEDWYVDPKVISSETISHLKSSNEYNNTAKSFMLKS